MSLFRCHICDAITGSDYMAFGVCADCQERQRIATSNDSRCGGLSCTPEMEAKMTPSIASSGLPLAEAVGMQRGMARNGRVIRRSDTMS